jgi:hypothetical protein
VDNAVVVVVVVAVAVGVVVVVVVVVVVRLGLWLWLWTRARLLSVMVDEKVQDWKVQLNFWSFHVLDSRQIDGVGVPARSGVNEYALSYPLFA